MMKMKSLAVAAALVFAAGAASAVTVVVDDFDAPAVPATITDTTVGGVAPTMSSATTAGNLATNRTVSIDMTSTPNLSNSKAEALMGGTPNGELAFSNSAGVNSIGKVIWTVGPLTPPPSGPTSYLFKVLFSDGGVAATLNLGFSFTGTGANAGNDFSFSNVIPDTAFPGGQAAFSLTAADANKFFGGGVLELTITGTQAWELILDQLALEIPEPLTLSLVGLGLLGVAGASRRRKAVAA